MNYSWIQITTLLSSILLTAFTSPIMAQFFDPKLDDQTYLDNIQVEVVQEVEETKAELMDQARIIQQVTKNYIAAKLKQNLFKALRVLAEKELQIDVMTMQDRPRQPRQEEEETESGGGGGGTEEEVESLTTRRPSQILPQVANLIKAVFGGNINLTSYVEAAATFLPKPVGNQLVGVVKLLANNPGHKYTTTTAAPITSTTTTSTTSVTKSVQTSPLPRTTGSVFLTAPPQPPPGNAAPPSAPFTLPPAPAGEDEDEDENARQIQLPGLSLLGNLGNSIGNLLSNNNNNNNNNNNGQKSTSNENQNRNGTSSGFEEEVVSSGSGGNKMSGFDAASLAKEVRNGLGDLIRVMPDLFRGAREAFQLLSAVTSLFSAFGN